MHAYTLLFSKQYYLKLSLLPPLSNFHQFDKTRPVKQIRFNPVKLEPALNQLFLSEQPHLQTVQVLAQVTRMGVVHFQPDPPSDFQVLPGKDKYLPDHVQAVLAAIQSQVTLVVDDVSVQDFHLV